MRASLERGLVTSERTSDHAFEGYSPDLARYAIEAAPDLPASVLNQSVDIFCDVAYRTNGGGGIHPRAGSARRCETCILASDHVAEAVDARPAPSLRDGVAVLSWVRKSGYISHDHRTQQKLFGPLLTIEDFVTSYRRDRGLFK